MKKEIGTTRFADCVVFKHFVMLTLYHIISHFLPFVDALAFPCVVDFTVLQSHGGKSFFFAYSNPITKGVTDSVTPVSIYRIPR